MLRSQGWCYENNLGYAETILHLNRGAVENMILMNDIINCFVSENCHRCRLRQKGSWTY